MTIAEARQLKKILVEGGFIQLSQWDSLYHALLKADLIRPKISGA
jgi:hypothetical protein